MPKGRFISYLRARKLISKRCSYYLVRVRDCSSKAPVLLSVPLVVEFPYIFLDDRLGIPPDREINFRIDILPNTQPIFILSYKMAPVEL